jgi:type VI secretion system protein ImpK
MERITEVTRAAFGALLQLRGVDPDSPPPAAVVHGQMREVVGDLLKLAGDAGFSQQDAQDMAYAVASLADELALAQSDAFRDHWMGQPLQFLFFQENQAGEGFFRRLQSIRLDPSRAEVLRVYYLCLLFGFKGRYQVRGGESELLETVESVGKELQRHRRPGAEILSPHGERPAEVLLHAKDSRQLLMVAGGALLLALLLFGGLQLWLRSTRLSVIDQLATLQPAQASLLLSPRGP